MTRMSGKAAVAAVLIWLALPTELSAGRWRGANVIVARQDGRQIRAELVAVKREALVLASLDGNVESVPVAEIKAIRLARRSKAWQGLLAGFVAGAVGGAVWGALSADEEWGTAAGAFFGGLIVSVPASLVGLAAGIGAGLDDEVVLEGLSEADSDRVLARLSRYAREPEAYVPPSGPSGVGGRKGRLPSSRYDRTRFRLAWMPGYRASGAGHFFVTAPATFVFAEEVPPSEAGLHSSTSYCSAGRPDLSFGRMSLAYALSRRFAAEVELYVPDRWTGHRSADLLFTSSADGVEYGDYVILSDRLRAVSLLAGLTYRAGLPAFLSPHSIELGVAAGPAWIDWTGSTLTGDLDFEGTESRRAIAWSARAGASYDYRFSPSFAIGLCADFRWMRGRIPTFSRTGRLTFRPSAYNEGPSLTRLTEVTIPGRVLDLGGLSVGLRFTVDF